MLNYNLKKYIPFIIILIFCTSCASTKHSPYKKRRKRIKPCNCPTFYNVNNDKTYAILFK